MSTATLPNGTVTLFFSDIEGSTKRWEQYPQQMQHALARHDALLRQAIEAHEGYVFKTVGDAFCAAFHTPHDALAAALAGQHALSAEQWDDTPGPIRVRMALHTGVTEQRDGDYFGQPVNRVARLLSAGHGGQTLLSLATQELVRDSLPTSASLQDLGEHRLKDLTRPERIFQLVAPGLPSEFTPLRTLDNRPNNLPMQHTELIGREQQVASVVQLLHQPKVHLLTLTGPGGTGKTRLALQAAAEMLDDLHDGVHFVNLAPISDPNLVISTVAQALGVKEVAGTPILDTLMRYLQAKDLLLVVDNFEQVVAAAPSVNRLIEAAPNLKVLATSRVPLRVQGEYEYAVPPLQLPDPRQSLPPLEKLTQYEAVRLFIERAQAVKADFQVTNDNAPAVAEICVRLDGLPLAIELAAARIKILPPQAILSRLVSRLKLLTGGARDVPVRQQMLRGAMEWSYDLLSDEEKKLFRRLSVFAGGRTLEAIEAICNAEGDLQVEVLDGVSSLVDKSLLRQEEGAGGEPRFVMLETIHELAREKLEESGEAEELNRRHANYFVTLAERAEPILRGGQKTPLDRAEWLTLLDVEHNNLRAALAWARRNGDAELMLRLSSSLAAFWVHYGYVSEGGAQLQAALAIAPTNALFDLQAKAYLELAGVAWWLDDPAIRSHALESSLALYRGLDDRRGIAHALIELAVVARREHDYKLAHLYAQESLALFTELGDLWGTRGVLGNLAQLAIHEGNIGLARSLLEEQLVVSRQLGDLACISDTLNNLAYLVTDGEGRLARTLWEESLAINRQIGGKPGLALVADSAAWGAMLTGDYVAARPLAEESVALSREMGTGWILGPNLVTLALIQYHQGQYRQAAETFREGLNVVINTQRMTSGLTKCLVGLAAIAAATGGTGGAVRAARLFGAADSLEQVLTDWEWMPVERIEYELLLAEVRTRVDEDTWQTAWEEGQAMSMEQAIAYALQEEEKENGSALTATMREAGDQGGTIAL